MFLFSLFLSGKFRSGILFFFFLKVSMGEYRTNSYL